MLAEDSNAERRRCPRTPSRLPVWYRSSDLELEVFATDLSVGGMFVECDLWDEEGATADVLLDHYMLGGPVEVTGKVVHVSREEKGRSGMGLRFNAPTPDKADAFLTRYSSNFGRRRILMVDDEPEILRMLDEWLDKAGHKFFGVQSPFKSLEAILRFKPHMLVLDVMMPGLGGADLCKLIRATPSLGNLPVLLYSALPESKLRALAEDCGANAWIQKGGRSSEVVRRIEQLLPAQTETALN